MTNETPTPPPALTATDRKAKQIIGQAVVRAYGLPGHQRVCEGCGYRRFECGCAEGPS